MADVILFGVPLSSFVRTACMTCLEKGVSYELGKVEFRSDAHKALHPWAKIPVMKHGDVTLYETAAIVRYIDEAFEGPSLQPKDAAGRGLMEQYISVNSAYLYPDVVRDYALKYIFPGEGGPDRASIEAALPRIRFDFGVLDAAYGKSEWIVGDALTLADLFLLPVVATAGAFPEGAEILAAHENLKRALDTLAARDSYKATQPSM